MQFRRHSRTLAQSRFAPARESASSAGPDFACAIRECRYFKRVGQVTSGKHRGLQRWTAHTELLPVGVGYRPHDPMNVNGRATRVRPQTDIDLVGMNKLSEYSSRVHKCGGQHGCLTFGQIGQASLVNTGACEPRTRPLSPPACQDTDQLLYWPIWRMLPSGSLNHAPRAPLS
jgi:hypothetical protein